MNFFQLLFGFSGRINRAKYWLAVLIYLVVSAALVIVFFRGPGSLPASMLTFDLKLPTIFMLIVVIVYIAMLVSGIAIGIKRLHDRDKSGWWLLVFYVLPAVLNWPVEATGPHLILSVASFALSIWGFVELACLRGTSGPNQYGPDPLAA